MSTNATLLSELESLRKVDEARSLELASFKSKLKSVEASKSKVEKELVVVKHESSEREKLLKESEAKVNWFMEDGIRGCIRSVLFSDEFSNLCASVQGVSVQSGLNRACLETHSRYADLLLHKDRLYNYEDTEKRMVEGFDRLRSFDYPILQFLRDEGASVVALQTCLDQAGLLITDAPMAQLEGATTSSKDERVGSVNMENELLQVDNSFEEVYLNLLQSVSSFFYLFHLPYLTSPLL